METNQLQLHSITPKLQDKTVLTIFILDSGAGSVKLIFKFVRMDGSRNALEIILVLEATGSNERILNPDRVFEPTER